MGKTAKVANGQILPMARYLVMVKDNTIEILKKVMTYL